MELIDAIVVHDRGTERQVQLLAGDLAKIPEQEAVDVLVVSAFPDDYAPLKFTLIGALSRSGVHVADLARDKEVDLRKFSSCWLSRPLDRPGLNFRRILCFEPDYRGRAAEVVGDIFRSIIPFTTGQPPISRIALPLVAAGSQGESRAAMLEALTTAAVHWLSVGLGLEAIKIVVLPGRDSDELRSIFSQVRRRYDEGEKSTTGTDCRFDFFVSYAHPNSGPVDHLVREMRVLRPGLKVFVDRLELQPGAAWQPHIFESLEASRRVICALSPEYLTSPVCKEEFNIALFRHREQRGGILLPLYLYTAPLPTYMKLIQYEDAREADPARIAAAAARFVAQL